SRGLLIAVPNADDPPSGNHESLESKIPKRKKPRPNTRLSCKIEYFIETTSAYLSGRSAFFTDDCGYCIRLDLRAPPSASCSIWSSDGASNATIKQRSAVSIM
ncbi:hypothetical protein, partial [Bradyrhizobium elkanii]|uniref:hypothetical protein n=1 Tax=Bradyrhizobium elkanii TaxID=29448 RepID=UPI001AEC90A0